MTIKIVGEPKQQILILATNEVIESRCVKSCNSLILVLNNLIFHQAKSENIEVVSNIFTEQNLVKPHHCALLGYRGRDLLEQS